MSTPSTFPPDFDPSTVTASFLTKQSNKYIYNFGVSYPYEFSLLTPNKYCRDTNNILRRAYSEYLNVMIKEQVRQARLKKLAYKKAIVEINEEEGQDNECCLGLCYYTEEIKVRSKSRNACC